MSENHTQKEQPKSTVKPRSTSTTTTNFSSGKRLLTNPNYNQSSSTPSPQSSVSSGSSSDQSRKRTREFPNLSDCHSCGLRINHTNPKDRLQILESVWRIVLLCKKCIKRVQFAEICAYCFHKTLESECFKCSGCKRFVHKDCVVKYGGFAPWSYCHLDSRFSVCVDCWVPNLLSKSIRVYKRRRRRNKRVGDSGVLVDSNGSKFLEGVVKDANCAVEKKIENMAKAKEDALRKAVVAKNAVEFANGVLSLVAKNDENCKKSECMDDEELAFQLHRAMNSSSRISRNSSSLNLSYSDVRKIGDWGVSEHSICGLDHASSVNLDNPNATSMTAIGITSLKDKNCQENCEIGMAEAIQKDVSAVDSLHSVLKSCQREDKPTQVLHPEQNTIQGLLGLGGNKFMLFYRRRNQKGDRYLLKYRKRNMSSKGVLNRETKSFYDCLRNSNQKLDTESPLKCCRESRAFSDASFPSCSVPQQPLSCASGSSREQPRDRHLLKYKKRPMSSKGVSNPEIKSFYDCLCLGNQNSAPELPLNFSRESRIFSVASFPSFTVSLQAFACANCSSQEKPQDRYLLKYRKRPTSSKGVSNPETKSFYDCLRLSNQNSAPESPLNCFRVLRTFSSCTVPLQEFACSSISSREQP